MGSGWSKCDSKCGAGHTHRARTCTKPAPAHGGKKCVGNAKEEKSCDSGACKPKCTDDEFEMDGKCYNKRVCKKIIDIVETNRCKKKTIADTIVQHKAATVKKAHDHHDHHDSSAGAAAASSASASSSSSS